MLYVNDECGIVARGGVGAGESSQPFWSAGYERSSVVIGGQQATLVATGLEGHGNFTAEVTIRQDLNPDDDFVDGLSLDIGCSTREATQGLLPALGSVRLN